jgi:methylenetetrahydrofolate dehydrogenase (NADP+)/methenyltetrahydrofolate cyclohydrolase
MGGNGGGRLIAGGEDGAYVIDGRAVAADVRAEVARVVASQRAMGVVPGLSVVLVGTDPASEVYVRAKEKAAREAGIAGTTYRLPAETTQEALLALVARLNADRAVHGILVQLPLPPQIDEAAVIAAVAPEKDVDGFHVANAGALANGLPGLVPCTPLGCLVLLRETYRVLGAAMAGREAVVLGRSFNVGRPMAQLLLGEDCTVTQAHSRTRDLAGVVGRAEILVAAVGRPGLVRAEWVRPGAVVIDVGITRTEAGLRGDVAPEARARAAAITPVPGGVGPMTIACLLSNTVLAAARHAGLPPPEGLPQV